MKITKHNTYCHIFTWPFNILSLSRKHQVNPWKAGIYRPFSWLLHRCKGVTVPNLPVVWKPWVHKITCLDIQQLGITDVTLVSRETKYIYIYIPSSRHLVQTRINIDEHRSWWIFPSFHQPAYTNRKYQVVVDKLPPKTTNDQTTMGFSHPNSGLRTRPRCTVIGSPCFNWNSSTCS